MRWGGVGEERLGPQGQRGVGVGAFHPGPEHDETQHHFLIISVSSTDFLVTELLSFQDTFCEVSLNHLRRPAGVEGTSGAVITPTAQSFSKPTASSFSAGCESHVLFLFLALRAAWCPCRPQASLTERKKEERRKENYSLSTSHYTIF